MPQVNNRKHVVRRRYDLNRLALARNENSAQHFVTANDLVDSLPEGRDIQWTTNMQRAVHVVDGAVRLELMQEPKTLLRERKEQRRLARDAHHCRNAVLPHAGPGHRIDLLGELSYGRTFKEFA